MKGGKKKSMLLAFQRDESTAFPKSPQRQHHREMEEKCCFFPSILMSKLCRLVKYYLEFVHAHFCVKLLKSFQDLFSDTSVLMWVCLYLY